MPMIVVGTNIVGLLLVAIRIILFSFQVDKPYEMNACQTIGNRELQEDYYDYAENKNVRLLAMSDGMGRSYGGRIAARTAVESSIDLFENYQIFDTPNYHFRKTFSMINKAIMQMLDGKSGHASLINVIIQDDYLYYALVGNIKLFIYRKEQLIEVTYGHTIDLLANNLYKTGHIKREEALQIIEEKRSYNFIGRDGFYDIEYFDEPIALMPKDIILMMTDGLLETLGYQQIEEIIKHKRGRVETLARDLVEAVNKESDEEKDNASVMVVKVKR